MASRVLAAFAFLLAFAAPVIARAEDKDLVWEEWNTELFDRAHAEQRLVILDLEAVWCHWCHVMERTTYRDAKGWPATNKICSQPVFDPADPRRDGFPHAGGDPHGWRVDGAIGPQFRPL